MAKLVKVIRILLKCKFDFKKVKKEKMLIFDTLSLQLVSKFKKFEILDVRYEVFNFCFTVSSNSFWREPLSWHC